MSVYKTIKGFRFARSMILALLLWKIVTETKTIMNYPIARCGKWNHILVLILRGNFFVGDIVDIFFNFGRS
ncbi:hypothetical protein RCL_jg26275.t1 [Rhizophagus clarus]|uniref:Uncharacterized protein n=1 Tax=Rhizophagus clarus TaxID=94130 RepID=A0A8H3L0A3_9GLOM|nr:hypothetical protein RCL_jg26275.t1 [Rhizophagus clarus]